MSGKRVLISGAGGFVGSALVARLAGSGHAIVRLSRRPAGGEVRWDPATGIDRPEQIEGLGAVVHLAGENISAGRWTAAQKDRIRRSRVDGTRHLAEALAAARARPAVLVSASAIGFYGDRGDEMLDEDSTAGAGFLADVCRAWEASTDPAGRAGIRVVNLRFGVILGAAGGALARMLLPFRIGVGGRIGSGRQHMSWITLQDAAGAIAHALETTGLRGPVNAVAPSTVTNAEFTAVLGRVLSRPTILPMPAFAARLALGEMADELLLASARVRPARLLASGYTFRQPELEPALREILERPAPST